MLLLRLEWASRVCASCPSDTIHPETHNASAPKTHASRLPIPNASYRLTLQAQCVITHSLKCTPTPPSPSIHPLLLSSLRLYAYALWAVTGYYWGCLESPSLLCLPFISDTVSNGRVCGAVERGRPGHAGLFQSRSVARVHGVGALHVPVVMPIGVGVSPVFDFDRGARLPPEMLRGLQSRLSLPGNREGQGQAFLRARRRFHHSAIIK